MDSIITQLYPLYQSINSLINTSTDQINLVTTAQTPLQLQQFWLKYWITYTPILFVSHLPVLSNRLYKNNLYKLLCIVYSIWLYSKYTNGCILLTNQLLPYLNRYQSLIDTNISSINHNLSNTIQLFVLHTIQLCKRHIVYTLLKSHDIALSATNMTRKSVGRAPLPYIDTVHNVVEQLQHSVQPHNVAVD